MNRRDFLYRLGCGAAVMAAGTWRRPVSAAEKSPNIVCILADDLTHEAIHALGCGEIETPNLDRLAGMATTFTRTYNMGGWHGAICVASRTMLMTGAYLWRAQQLEKDLDGLCRAKKLWPQRLAAAGYHTCITGKWHIEVDPGRVFDQISHIRGGMPPQEDPGYYNRPVPGEADPWKPWDTARGGYWEGGKHWSEVQADDAVGYLETAPGDKPLFLYAAFNAPHDPRQSPKEYLDRYPMEKIPVPDDFLPVYPDKDAIGCTEVTRDEKLAPYPRTEYAVKTHRREYYAIINHLDTQIGRILDAMERLGMMENTVIFFTADNGLACGHHGLFGKQNMFDDSMRVPLMVAGPGIGKGRRIDAPVYMQDIMPTALALAGAAADPDIQFRSLLPWLRDGQGEGRDAIYGAYMDLQRMVVMDRYKLMYYPRVPRTLLFDLEKDPHEMNDLAGDPAYADRRDRLWRRLVRFQAEMGDPLSLKEVE